MKFHLFQQADPGNQDAVYFSQMFYKGNKILISEPMFENQRN